MKQTATEEQNPPHGGSFVREADGSLTLKEGTKPAEMRRKPAPGEVIPEPQSADQVAAADEE